MATAETCLPLTLLFAEQTARAYEVGRTTMCSVCNNPQNEKRTTKKKRRKRIHTIA